MTENFEEEALENLKKIEKKFNSVEQLEEKVSKMSKQLLDLQQKGLDASQFVVTENSECAVLGKQIETSAGFKSFKEGSTPKFKVDLNLTKAEPSPLLTSGLEDSTRKPGVVDTGFKPLSLESALNSQTIATGAFEYVRETGFTNNATIVAEGSQKPFSTVTPVLKTGKVHTFAHLARISRQMFDDMPTFVSFLQTRMAYGLNLAVENALINGQGGENAIEGLLKEDNYTAVESAGASCLFDLILIAKAQIQKAGFIPDTVLLNPMDWARMLMQKNNSADYYLNGPVDVANNILWGLKVFEIHGMPEGKFLVLDAKQAATLWNRTGTTIEVFEQDGENVQKNLITVRAERRLGLSVERPEAIAGGSLSIAADTE